MKRPSTWTHIVGVSFGDPFDNLSTDQLAYVGAVALLYNTTEDQIDAICGEGLRIPIYDAEVLSRINGIDGKIELIKISAKHWGFSAEESAFLAETLGESGFTLLKRWRDAVVHARMFDPTSGRALVPERRGKFAEVLLSTEALEGLYFRLAYMQLELRSLHHILERRGRLSRGGIDAQQRERLEQENREEWVRCRDRRQRRLSLRPMPEFPPENFLGRLSNADPSSFTGAE